MESNPPPARDQDRRPPAPLVTLFVALLASLVMAGIASAFASDIPGLDGVWTKESILLALIAGGLWTGLALWALRSR